MITTKLNTGCSVVVPPVVKKVTLKLPAPTAVTLTWYKSVPDFWTATTASVTATEVLVTVKVAAVAEPAAETRVIAPETPVQTTAVVRLVARYLHNLRLQHNQFLC